MASASQDLARGRDWLGNSKCQRGFNPGIYMKIYLASRYTRRLELFGYRASLRSLGFTVEARWLDGQHQLDNVGIPIGDGGEKLVEGGDDPRNAQLRAKFAQDDWEDVSGADVVVSFTEAPRSSANRGGRHAEFGIALARNARVIVVGFRENIFHWLPRVEFVQTFDEAVLLLRGKNLQ